jgi:endonuclease/exonuclease/phosphatase family metal-dependent hydrolase
MKALLQGSRNGRVPVLPEKRFLISSAATVTGLLALWLSAAGVLRGEDVSLSVMSFNILEDLGTPSATDSNKWIYTPGPSRRDRAVRLIAEQAADIVGVQEAEPNQVADITTTNALAVYAWFGAGRVDGQSAGQHELILYRTNRFVRTDAGVFWLSLTPDVPGSKHPDAAQIRIAVWVQLLDRLSGHTCLVMNTHWDFVSATARQYSAGLMRARLGVLAPSGFVIVTGDFNMDQDEQAYGTLRGTGEPSGLQLFDSYRQVVPVEQANELTRHFFSGATAGRRVDYTFHTGEFTASTAAIVRTSYDGGRFPSDHYPVTAELRVSLVVPAIRTVEVNPERVSLAWSSVTGLPYRVRVSDDLLVWSKSFPLPAVGSQPAP